jgi:uncharacterized protein YegJ (DUF2314 family)
MFLHRIGVAIFAATFCLAAFAAPAQTTVSTQNEAVNAAIEKAKRTLPVFFERLDKPQRGDTDFQIKIRFVTNQPPNGEHVWARDVRRDGTNVTATIATVPRNIPDLKQGQRVTVPITQVTDWLIENGGKYHGAYTVRALLPYMGKDEADEMRRSLAPE